jgi:hypothetical protein
VLGEIARHRELTRALLEQHGGTGPMTPEVMGQPPAEFCNRN